MLIENSSDSVTHSRKTLSKASAEIALNAFLEFGLDPPGDEGVVWGWIICAVLFFLMGGPNYEIVNNSEDMGIRVVDFRHEQAAAMAAHAYARVTGKPGVTTAALDRLAASVDRAPARSRQARLAFWRTGTAVQQYSSEE